MVADPETLAGTMNVSVVILPLRYPRTKDTGICKYRGSSQCTILLLIDKILQYHRSNSNVYFYLVVST